MRDLRRFYINGAWVLPARPRDLAVSNPATEEVCATISLGDQADTDAAFAAARAALAGWSATSPAQRMDAVRAILAQYRARSEDMAQAIREEMGAPIDFARALQAEALPWHINGFLDAMEAFDIDRPLRPDTPGDRILHDPVGVVGLITPWNWPINQIALKAIPAMLAGCTAVLKPSEEAPLSAHLFAEFVHDAGVPPGVFNLVDGDGVGVGSQLSSHPDVDMISFTGSARAGRAISVAAAGTLKRVTLELGGKGANIIFADADDAAVERGVLHCMENTGQSCNAPTRMLVERSVYAETLTRIAEISQNLTVGDPARSGSHLGPLINRAQWQKVQDYIRTGIDEGARLIAGGPGMPEGVNRGFYARPTVFADVDNGMTIAREEIFGLVLCVIPFEDEADAIRIANDSPYGLTHYVQSQDGARCNRVARALRAGMVDMNGAERAQGAPFGGVKRSGRAREGGIWGIEEFLDVKSVSGWSPT